MYTDDTSTIKIQTIIGIVLGVIAIISIAFIVFYKIYKNKQNEPYEIVRKQMEQYNDMLAKADLL